MPDAENDKPTELDIVIVGAMGSGKTTLGQDVARELGRDFHDSDLSIRQRTGLSGRELAEREGVESLHEMERRVLLESLGAPGSVVVAAAASVIEHPEVRAALEDAYCVWVTAPSDVLAARSARGTHRRDVAPSEHLERRDPLFAEVADLVVDTGALSPTEAAKRVVDDLAPDRS